jgi:hypothetical protein
VAADAKICYFQEIGHADAENANCVAAAAAAATHYLFCALPLLWPSHSRKQCCAKSVTHFFSFSNVNASAICRAAHARAWSGGPPARPLLRKKRFLDDDRIRKEGRQHDKSARADFYFDGCLRRQ